MRSLISEQSDPSPYWHWALSWRWILSHVFVLAMTVLMIGLGLWQLNRLDQTQQQNAAVAELFATLPQPIENLLRATPRPPDNTLATVTGRYLDQHSFLVANRSFDSEPGSWLVTPMRLADGRVVVVSRGWVPRLWVAGIQDADLSPPQGETTLVGRVYRSVRGGRIGGVSEVGLTELNRLDLTRVEEITGLEVAHLWLQLEQQQPTAAQLPAAVPRTDLDDGPHLSYAVQWFFFASGTVVVYLLILARRNKPNKPSRATRNRREVTSVQKASEHGTIGT